jgi:hypothetical protein
MSVDPGGYVCPCGYMDFGVMTENGVAVFCRKCGRVTDGKGSLYVAFKAATEPTAPAPSLPPPPGP